MAAGSQLSSDGAHPTGGGGGGYYGGGAGGHAGDNTPGGGGSSYYGGMDGDTATTPGANEGDGYVEYIFR